MKNFKTFYEAKIASCLKEMIPPPPDTPTTNMFGGKFIK